MGLLRSVGTAGAAAIAAIAISGCGDEKPEVHAPALSSTRVAMTADFPGYAPFALITYRDAGGRRCHGLGSITPHGPRVMGALGKSLVDGLTSGGTCLRADGRDVSLQVRRTGRGAPRVVGGIVREGVTRIVIGGQAVRPRRSGEFLLVQPAGNGPLGDEIELEYHAGGHRRLPLQRVAS